MTDLFSVEGNDAEYVDTHANHPTTPGADPIVEISPDRGLFIRLLNKIAKTTEPGIPVYMDLRDSNGDPLPPSTSAYFALKLQGMEEPAKVSQKRGNISFWTSNDITTQRDTDNVDGSLFVLTRPETEGGQTVPQIDVRDIDVLYFNIDGAAAVDWDESEFYIDTNAVQEGSL